MLQDRPHLVEKVDNAHSSLPGVAAVSSLTAEREQADGRAKSHSRCCSARHRDSEWPRRDEIFLEISAD